MTLSRKTRSEIVLSDAALSDLDDIMAYTLETFGVEQVQTYRKVFADAFGSLELYPEMGRVHSSLPKKHRSYQAGKHVIFYLIKGKKILVSRILHERRHFANHL